MLNLNLGKYAYSITFTYILYFRNLTGLIQMYPEDKIKDSIFLMTILGWILGQLSIQIQIIGLGILSIYINTKNIH